MSESNEADRMLEKLEAIDPEANDYFSAGEVAKYEKRDPFDNALNNPARMLTGLSPNERDELLDRANNTTLNALLDLEWSGKSREDFGHGDYSNVPCCPSCRRLNYWEPYTHLNKGHKAGCVLKRAIDRESR